MGQFAFVTWEGGGNVWVALGIGAALIERGHSVTIVGPSSLRESIQEAGLDHRELGPSAPFEPASRGDYLVEVVSSTTLAPRLQSLIHELEPDALVVDCNLSWALESRTGIPTAVLVHTALGLYLGSWQTVIDAANHVRHSAGLPPFRPAMDAWSSHEVLLVTSMIHFDRPPVPLPANTSYVGLVQSPLQRQVQSPSVLEQLKQPLVFVSYSTDALQNRPEGVQAALDGLADMPVQVLATTSGAYGIEQLSVPTNAVVIDYIPHDQVMPRASVVVGHAGHGTTLSALCHGIPLVCIPGLGRDQTPIAERVAELGLGIALASGATPDDIGTAVGSVLRDDSYQQQIQAFKRRCDHRIGATTASVVLEGMLEPR